MNPIVASIIAELRRKAANRKRHIARSALGGPNLHSAAVTASGTTITPTATSKIDLSSGVYGVEYTIGTAASPPSGYSSSINTTGAAAGAQTIARPAAGDGVAATSFVNVRVYYNLDALDAAGTRVYASNTIAPYCLAGTAPTGTAREGQTLTGVLGLTVGGDGQSLSYQWQRDGGTGTWVNISSATSATYVAVAADVGSDLRRGQKSTNQSGDSGFVYSTETAAIGYWVDISSPVCTTPTSTGATSCGFTTTTASGTGYVIAIGNGETAPTAAQVVAGVSYTGATVYEAANAAVGGTTFTGLTLDGLSASTNYDVYFVHRSAGGLNSAVSAKVDLATTAAGVTFVGVSPYIFDNQVTASSTEYVGPNNPASIAGTEANWKYAMAADITFTDLLVLTASTQNAGGSLVITLRKNGASTGITHTIAAGAVAGTFSSSGSVAFAVGDLLSFELVNNAAAASAEIRSIILKGT